MIKKTIRQTLKPFLTFSIKPKAKRQLNAFTQPKDNNKSITFKSTIYNLLRTLSIILKHNPTQKHNHFLLNPSILSKQKA